MADYKVSVIIPTYNNGKYIEKCIRSVLDQTYKNLEIIVIDDGSTDDTKSICESFMEGETKVVYYYQQNQGVSVARNYGIEIATGDFVMFVDSDDWLSDDCIETLVLKADGSDIISCCCNVVGEKQEINHFFESSFVAKNRQEKECFLLQISDFDRGQPNKVNYTAIGVPWGKLYRRSFLISNKLQFKIDLKRLQDNVFNMYAFELADAVTYIDVPLYNYRVNHISTYKMGYSASIQKTVIHERMKFLNDFGYNRDSEIYNTFHAECAKRSMWAMRDYLVSNKLNEGKRLILESIREGRLLQFKEICSNKRLNHKYLIAANLMRCNCFFLVKILFDFDLKRTERSL
ncbi:glycosyltransferase family 2 protein [Butyrivibrio sp. MB2005]|uniref:glycosyltransferase family 2 protein n=1 Tax=Butyrivibrio sp. MB2005 TaxID=1280678 RepID=UPI0003FF1B86|nr:glycosyltransferase family 2 protein [Butyrivibrio sp. MB2005]